MAVRETGIDTDTRLGVAFTLPIFKSLSPIVAVSPAMDASTACNVGKMNSPASPLCILMPNLSRISPFSSGSMTSPTVTGTVASAVVIAETSARVTTLMPFSETMPL